MIGRRTWLFASLVICVSSLSVDAGGFSGGIEEALGPHFKAQPQDTTRVPKDHRNHPRHNLDLASSVRQWNEIAIDASGLDHTPVAPGENRVFGEQLGPGRSSRAMAIVHIAMFEVVNAIERQYRSYTGLGKAAAGVSVKAAVSQAAHDTLIALFPHKRRALMRLLPAICKKFRRVGSRRMALHSGSAPPPPS